MPSLANHAHPRPTGAVTALALELRRTLGGDGAAERVRAASVSGNLFATLGAAARLGRTLLPAEDTAPERLVVLSEGLWRRRYGGDGGVVGRVVVIDDLPYTVVGVMPASFRFPEPADLWTLGDRGIPELFGFRLDLPAQRDVHYFTVVGRLAPGVTVAAAQREMASIAAGIESRFPETNRDLGVNVVSLRDALVGDTRRTALVLFAVVGIVLLIACANVAALMLARSAAREREFAVRAALGATRPRLVAQVASEGLLLAAAGGFIGCAAAWAATGALVRAAPLELPEAAAVAVDGRVVAFALALSCIAGLAFGLIPALQLAGAASLGALRAGGRTTAGAARPRLRSALVVGQLALSLALLVGAGLLLKSLRSLLDVHPGFRVEDLVAVTVSLSPQTYADDARAAGYYRQALDAVAALPGVRSAAVVTRLPTAGRSMNRGFRIDGRPTPPRQTDQTVEYQVASPDYFATMGIPRRRGRGLEPSDHAAAPAVAVINEAAARRFWRGEDPVGARVGFGGGDGTTTWRTVVGVVGDVHHFGLDREAPPEIYVPMAQAPARGMSLVARASSGAQAAAAVHRAVAAVDPTQPVSAPRPMTDMLADSVARPRFLSLALTAFAVVAVALAALGVYGVLAHLAQTRTREIGVRMALGARAADVLRMMLGHAARLAVLGIALGAAGALALSRMLATLLFGVAPTDGLVLGAAAALLAAVAVGAGLIPARRAAAVDPAIVLRAD
ncbi:MAG TPA: ADOP family duplicated permease [Gemmatimonadaceae bacterium]|nr:ADOP family duplicated permease [Gemmatimonadaceae bacterium]